MDELEIKNRRKIGKFTNTAINKCTSKWLPNQRRNYRNITNYLEMNENTTRIISNLNEMSRFVERYKLLKLNQANKISSLNHHITRSN